MNIYPHSSRKLSLMGLIWLITIFLTSLASGPVVAVQSSPAQASQPPDIPGGLPAADWLSLQNGVGEDVTRITSVDGRPFDGFSESVAVDGDTVVIGAPNVDGQGAVYIFERNLDGSGVWSQVVKRMAADGNDGDSFGQSVAVDGDTIAVGAPYADVNGNSNQGAVYIFERNRGGSDVWGQAGKRTASLAAAEDRFGWSVAVNGDRLVAGAPNATVNGMNYRGEAYLFERDLGNPGAWAEKARLFAADGAADDQFGYAVDVSGDTILVSAPWASVGGVQHQGAAYIFDYDQEQGFWLETVKLTVPELGELDLLGWSSAISGDTVVLGAWPADVGSNRDQGVAYVFERTQDGENAWARPIPLTASDGTADDWFSYAVDIDGDVIVVGALYDQVDGNYRQGSAYVFERNQGGGNTWGQTAKLTTSDGAAGDWLGYAVAVSGDTAITGAANANVGGNDGQGAAYVFERNQGDNSAWGQVAKLISVDGRTGDYFGSAVAADDSTVIVGAPYAAVNFQDNRGAAYLFSRDLADNWQQITRLVAVDGEADDWFGLALALSGDTVVVGSPAARINGNYRQGAAYIFERNQGGSEAWGQAAKLVASDGAAVDLFAATVAIDGDIVIVGSYNAAYIFERNHGGSNTWGEVTKLTAADGQPDDDFGSAVAIAGDTAVVGAGSADVNGQADQGVAYVFERNQDGEDAWGEVMKLTASDGLAADFFGSAVAIARDTVLVAAVLADVNGQADQGAAYIFERNQGGANAWGETTRLTASDGAAADRFGSVVSLRQDTALVGAWQVTARTGAAYVFGRHQDSSSDWGQTATLTATGGIVGDEFGFATAIGGGIAVVGAPGEDFNYHGEQGAAYIFTLETTDDIMTKIFLPLVEFASRP